MPEKQIDHQFDKATFRTKCCSRWIVPKLSSTRGMVFIPTNKKTSFQRIWDTTNRYDGNAIQQASSKVCVGVSSFGCRMDRRKNSKLGIVGSDLYFPSPSHDRMGVEKNKYIHRKSNTNFKPSTDLSPMANSRKKVRRTVLLEQIPGQWFKGVWVENSKSCADWTATLLFQLYYQKKWMKK